MGVDFWFSFLARPREVGAASGTGSGWPAPAGPLPQGLHRDHLVPHGPHSTAPRAPELHPSLPPAVRQEKAETLGTGRLTCLCSLGRCPGRAAGRGLGGGVVFEHR